MTRARAPGFRFQSRTMGPRQVHLEVAFAAGGSSGTPKRRRPNARPREDLADRRTRGRCGGARPVGLRRLGGEPGRSRRTQDRGDRRGRVGGRRLAVGAGDLDPDHGGPRPERERVDGNRHRRPRRHGAHRDGRGAERRRRPRLPGNGDRRDRSGGRDRLGDRRHAGGESAAPLHEHRAAHRLRLRVGPDARAERHNHALRDGTRPGCRCGAHLRMDGHRRRLHPGGRRRGLAAMEGPRRRGRADHHGRRQGREGALDLGLVHARRRRGARGRFG